MACARTGDLRAHEHSPSASTSARKKSRARTARASLDFDKDNSTGARAVAAVEKQNLAVKAFKGFALHPPEANLAASPNTYRKSTSSA